MSADRKRCSLVPSWMSIGRCWEKSEVCDECDTAVALSFLSGGFFDKLTYGGVESTPG